MVLHIFLIWGVARDLVSTTNCIKVKVEKCLDWSNILRLPTPIAMNNNLLMLVVPVVKVVVKVAAVIKITWWIVIELVLPAGNISATVTNTWLGSPWGSGTLSIATLDS